MSLPSYIGRFAPSPTGPLHAGSLVAALASWLDARAHGGQWLLRIEDVDTPRCGPGAANTILQQLARCGLLADEAPVYQSQRGTLYQKALDQLILAGLAFPCSCTRQDIASALALKGHTRERHGELVYPGTCRLGLHDKPARAWRFLTSPAGQSAEVMWTDRRLGLQRQNVSEQVGDFVLHRADGLWAYQLAVVVDDAAQGITDVMRGEDLADNTARQILLQRALGLPTPRYLHTPLVRGANGEKLSKRNGAQALRLSDPLAALTELNAAAACLNLPASSGTLTEVLTQWTQQWTAQWALKSPSERFHHSPA
ncbi:MAG: glutamyl-Q tRNA(Asp) synthetase [Litorivivens sp.]